MATKYIFVTGGVVSGLGKGITAASLGRLLKTRGLKVASQKLDPYINVDPGTMSPLQHGEVFVTDDGTETALHVGLGTFRPVKEDDITDHLMHSEYCVIPQETADLINETKKNGGRVICVGTTSCRTVESWAAENGTMKASAGWTSIFIYPGYKFKVLDALVTNFHLPESTLIMLVSALAGREHVLRAYEEAVRERYRFFSFGDAMFIH